MPVPTEDIDDPEFEIEKIVEMKTQGGRKKYRVRYLGYSELYDQWKMIADLRNCMEFVHEYNTRDDSRVVLAITEVTNYILNVF